MNELREFLTDSALAFGEHFDGWRSELSSFLHRFASFALHGTRNFLFALFAFLAASCITIAVAACCIAGALLSSLAIRHYVLLHVPGSQLFSLDLNTMPFVTDLWRLRGVDRAVDSFGHFLSPPGGFDGPAAVAQDAAAMKMSLVGEHITRTRATGTLVIPSVLAREVFPPGGGVSLEALFRKRTPMFNARGIYHARAQLVFAREERGRRCPLMLETRVLLAEEPHVPQALSTLDVLFKTTTSFTLTTGYIGTESWLRSILTGVLQFVFPIPIKLYRYVLAVLHNDVFPLVDEDNEVATIVTVYDGFEPPDALQPRLRAINFTLYQRQASDGEAHVHLSRMNVFASVELYGMAYYLTFYPVTSFIIMTLVLLTIFSTFAAIGGFGSIATLAVFMFNRRKKLVNTADTMDSELDDESSTVYFGDVIKPTRPFKQTMSISSVHSLEKSRRLLEGSMQSYSSLDLIPDTSASSHEKKKK